MPTIQTKRATSSGLWRESGVFYIVGAATASIVVQASSLPCIAERCFEGSQGIYPLDHETMNSTASR